MTPITDAQRAGSDAAQALTDLRKDGHPEAVRMTVLWLDALIAQHQAHALTAPADKLAANQLRTQQIVALRDALTSPANGGTGFIF